MKFHSAQPTGWACPHAGCCWGWGQGERMSVQLPLASHSKNRERSLCAIRHQLLNIKWPHFVHKTFAISPWGWGLETTGYPIRNFLADMENNSSNAYGNHISHLFKLNNSIKSLKLGVDKFVEIPLSGSSSSPPTRMLLIVFSIAIDFLMN